jgi:hypothetical protein
VVAFYLAKPFRYVTIKPDEKADSLGHVRFPKAPKWVCDDYSSRPLKQREFWENDIIVSFAGRISQQKHKGKRVRFGHGSDYAQASDHAFASYGGRGGADVHIHWYRWLHARSNAIVELRWREIGAVAEALLKRETLSLDEVREVIDRALGLPRLTSLR